MLYHYCMTIHIKPNISEQVHGVASHPEIQGGKSYDWLIDTLREKHEVSLDQSVVVTSLTILGSD